MDYGLRYITNVCHSYPPTLSCSYQIIFWVATGCLWVKAAFVLWSHYIFSFLVATPLPTISSISVVWTGDTSFTAFFRWRWQLFSHSFWRTFVVLGFLLEHVAIDTTICHFHRANQDKTTMFWLLLSSLGMIIIDPTIFWMKTLPSMNLPRHCRNFPILSSFHACWLRMFPPKSLHFTQTNHHSLGRLSLKHFKRTKSDIQNSPFLMGTLW